MRFRRRPVRLTLGLACGFALAAAVGVATGSIPGGDGKISGCYTNVGGVLRVIDKEKTPRESCKSFESAITWSQQGPKGNAGPAGPSGPQGPKGNTGPAGPSGSQGSRGDAGPVGPTGIEGPKGDTGAPGEKGETGETGALPDLDSLKGKPCGTGESAGSVSVKYGQPDDAGNRPVSLSCGGAPPPPEPPPEFGLDPEHYEWFVPVGESSAAHFTLNSGDRTVGPLSVTLDGISRRSSPSVVAIARGLCFLHMSLATSASCTPR